MIVEPMPSFTLASLALVAGMLLGLSLYWLTGMVGVAVTSVGLVIVALWIAGRHAR
jgi:hypothetical protein